MKRTLSLTADFGDHKVEDRDFTGTGAEEKRDNLEWTLTFIATHAPISLFNEVKRRKTFPPPETRMVVYVRQENEEIFTPLHLVPPTG